MTGLQFSVLDARPAAQCAVPSIVFRLRAEREGPGRVHALALRTQILIDARARRYTGDEQTRLYELFGPAALWDRALGPVPWTAESVMVPTFDDAIELDVPVACTYELGMAATKYLHALRDGDIPLSFLFTGTMFTVREHVLNAEPVPWDRQAAFRLPARVWHDTMDRFFPGGGWIRLERDTLDRLLAVRGRLAFVSWDEVVDALMTRERAGEAMS